MWLGCLMTNGLIKVESSHQYSGCRNVAIQPPVPNN
jgi:hypothetical protein